MNSGNLYRDIPHQLPAEIIDTLAASPSGSMRIERIVSQGHCSPPDFWYDQEQAEWVLLLQGAAVVRFETDNRMVQMAPGDYLSIAAHEKHRVESTSDIGHTIWLAIFY